MRILNHFILSAMLALLFSLPCEIANAAAAIAGGTETTLYPAVVNVNGCTATYIRKNVLLTAAHCIKPRIFIPAHDPAHFHTNVTLGTDQQVSAEVYFRSAQINPFAADYMTHFNNAINQVSIDFDLALMVLDTPSSDLPLLTLAANIPVANDPVTLIGYGNSDYTTFMNLQTGYGTKRIGSNQILDVKDHAILIRGQTFVTGQTTFGQNATLKGDSGGPLIDAQGKIIGILSGWVLFGMRNPQSTYWLEDLNPNEEVSVYQRVDLPEVQSWIRTVLGE